VSEAAPSVAIIIPARLGSARYPNKPLAPILGTAMVELVHRHAALVPGVDTVAVATCDQEIVDLVEGAGGIAVMTSESHQRASDRSAEAVLALERARGRTYDIVLMLQGDEPAITPHQMGEVIEAMAADSSIQVTNLHGTITSEREFNDPNCIKVVTDLVGDAVYFSRLPIPHGASFDDPAVGKQVCAIGFRRDYLMEYLEMAPTELEVLESIDMLRILQHGDKVRMVRTTQPTQSVDVPEDIPLAEALLKRLGLA
jgi:3-deoxy-manno-octulosonate cytidylyltransferase (CMP-KDO synthetase)